MLHLSGFLFSVVFTLTILFVVCYVVIRAVRAVVTLIRRLAGETEDRHLGRRVSRRSPLASATQPEAKFREQLQHLYDHGMISDSAYAEVSRGLTRFLQVSQQPPSAGLRPDRPAESAAPSPVDAPVPRPAPPAGMAARDHAESSSPSLPTTPTPHDPTAPTADVEPPLARTPRERVEQFARRRHEAQQEELRVESVSQADTSHVDDKSSVRHPPWNRLLAAFLEEKNIRWGELVGGLLIVSCSIALVVSFWSAIAERPFLKFGVLNGVTASLFALGLYAAGRWKLPTTSQGILLTSILLVPLNFLAIAALSQVSSQITLPVLIGELFSIGLFSSLVYLAARWIVPDWPWSLTLGVMIPCVCQLVMRRHITETSPVSALYGFGLVGLTGFVAVHADGLRTVLGSDAIDERRANELLKRLGVVIFSLLVSVGLMLAKTQHPMETLRWLSPLAVLAVVPVIGCGMVLWNRPGAQLANYRMVGASLCAIAVFILLAALVAAWPQPALLVSLCLSCVLVTLFLAIVLPMPEGHTMAFCVLSLAIVLASHVGMGSVGWFENSAIRLVLILLSASTGHSLTAMALGGFGLTAVLTRYHRQAEARAYRWGSVLVAGLGLALICIFGFARAGDPDHVAPVLAAYSGVAFVVGLRAPSRWAVGICGALLLGALVQFFEYGPVGLEFQVPRAMIPTVHALIIVCLAVGLSVFRAELRPHLFSPLSRWVWVSSIAAALLTFFGSMGLESPPMTLGWARLLIAGLALTWLALSWLESSGVALGLAQCALLTTGVIQVDLWQQQGSWFEPSASSRLDPRYLQNQAAFLSAFGLLWVLLRRGMIGPSANSTAARPVWRHKLSELLSNENASVDAVATILAIGLLLALSVYRVAPGVAQELSLRLGVGRVVPPVESFLWRGIPHHPIPAWGTWMTVLFSALACIGWFQRNRSAFPAIGLAVVGSTISLLLAARFEDTVAVASALRWSTALYFLAASTLVWTCRYWDGIAGFCGLVFAARSRQDRTTAFSVLALISAIPILVMLLFVAQQALAVSAVNAADRRVALSTGVIALLGCVVTLICFHVSRHPRWRHVRWVPTLAGSVLILACMPLLAVTLNVVGRALVRHPVNGPDASSWFVRIGLAASYTTPLLLIAATVIGHAISCRSWGIALTGGLLLNVSATAACLLSQTSGTLGIATWILLAHINGIVASAYGLAGHLIERWARDVGNRWASESASASTALSPDRRPNWSGIQRGMASGFTFLPIAAGMLAVLTGSVGSSIIDLAANRWGWAALVTCVLLWWVSEIRRTPPQRDRLTVWTLMWGMIMLALTCHGWQSAPANFSLSLHAMQIAFGTSAALVLTAERRGRLAWVNDLSQPVVSDDTALRLGAMGCLPLFGLIAYSLTAWLGDNVPGATGRTGWAVAGFVVAWVLCTDRGWLVGRQRWWFLAATCFSLAALIAWDDYGPAMPRTAFEASIRVGVLSLAGLVPLWVALDRRRLPLTRRRPTVQGVATGLSLASTALLCWVGLLSHQPGAHPAVVWLSVAGTGMAIVSTFWDRRIRWSGVACYVFSLFVVGTLLDRLNLANSQLLWSGTIMLSVHGIATSYLWSRRESLMGALARSGMSTDEVDRKLNGVSVVALNLLLAACVCVLAGIVVLTEDNSSLRLVVSQAACAQALSVGLLAHGRRATSLRYTALLIAVIGAVLFGWSWFAPTASVLDRAVVMAAVLMGMAAFYAIGLVKLIQRPNDWTVAANRLVPGLVVAATVLVLGVLAGEAAYFISLGQVPIAWPTMLAVSLALLVSAAASVIAAIVPGRDPLGLSDRQRMVYVYAAEALLAVLMIHVRMCVPELFGGVLQRYWCLIVMALAFLGIGLSELFKRQGREVLAEPLERTGAMLPLLPMLGFWVGTGDVHMSIVMLVAGGIYAALSLMRRSFGFGVLAALAANGALWYFLQTTANIQFLVHPQLWLIPPSVCVLVAAYLNRDQLNASQMTTIRYLTSTVIYASSTADIFINGVAEAPWLPFVLAGFSLGGIFLGIMIRVRAFLFLGLAFLAISLFSIIWHAAVDLQQTWIWYVSGIVAGVLIIAVFAVFERRRNDVLQVVEQLKSWER